MSGDDMIDARLAVLEDRVARSEKAATKGREELSRQLQSLAEVLAEVNRRLDRWEGGGRMARWMIGFGLTAAGVMAGLAVVLNRLMTS